MKFMAFLALLALLAVGCGSHPIACPCLEIRVTGGANNTPLRDAQIWLIDSVAGDQQFSAALVVDSLYIGGAACLPIAREYEVRRSGYVSQRFTHAPSVERNCNSTPPFPMVAVHMQAQ
jgi:hypothetical protein